MRCLLDLQVLQAESAGRGIGRYSRGLAAALLNGSYGAEFSVLLNIATTKGRVDRSGAANKPGAVDYWSELEQLKNWLSRTNSNPAISYFRGLTGVAGMLGGSLRTNAADAVYTAFVKAQRCDLVHISSPFEGFGDDTVVGWSEFQESGPVRAATVYDLIPLEEPDVYLTDPVRARWYKRRIQELARADLIMTISEHTRRVVLAYLDVNPDIVVNISSDTEEVFGRRVVPPSERAELLARYGISKPFIMHVGVLEERKNVAFLIRAFANIPQRVRSDFQLVIVADNTREQTNRLRAAAVAAGLDPDDLIFTGFVPDADLNDLYCLTSALVMPSLTEGFGLPVLEAMRCGAPALASDATSLPEVVGDANLLFSGKESSSLTTKLIQVLTDAGFRSYAVEHGARQEKKFSWKRTATLAADAFAEAVARRTARRATASDRRYIIVPPHKQTLADASHVRSVAGRLEAYGNAVLAGSDAASRHKPKPVQGANVDLQELSPGPDQNIILACGASGLDLFQQALLARMPAIVSTAAPEQSIPDVTPELVYLTEGYRPLLKGSGAERVCTIADLSKAHWQIMGVISPNDENLKDKLESFTRTPLAIVGQLLSQLQPLDEALCEDVASAIAKSFFTPAARRLFVDVGSLTRRDKGTGIQRVVKNLLRCLLLMRLDVRVEPIYRDGDHYRYARRFTCGIMGIAPLKLPDAVVDFCRGDSFLALDLDVTISQEAAGALKELRALGGTVAFVVYDLLPIFRPDAFDAELVRSFDNWFNVITQTATSLIAISGTVAGEINRVLEERGADQISVPSVGWFHLGTDIVRSDIALYESNDDWAEKCLLLAQRPFFLTVGTIEPRKGIAQLLSAAEEIWTRHDIAFVLVGHEGWLVSELIERIRGHKEFGRRLLWFTSASDALLAHLYDAALAVVMPSEAEGFGLPLIESAAAGTPVIARDIPVFREIGGSNVHYFRATNGPEMARVLEAWLHNDRAGHGIKIGEIKPQGWSAAAIQLLEVLGLAQAPYALKLAPKVASRASL